MATKTVAAPAAPSTPGGLNSARVGGNLAENCNQSPDGALHVPRRVRLYPFVSCITVDAAVDVSYLSHIDCFDVPKEDFGDGNLTGMKVAWEVLEEVASTDCADALCMVLEEAYKEKARSSPEPGHDRRGAAVGFIDAILAVVCKAVGSWDFRPTLAEEIRGYDEYVLAEAKALKRSNAAFIASMNALGKVKVR